jgi:hypothetical protein
MICSVGTSVPQSGVLGTGQQMIMCILAKSLVHVLAGWLQILFVTTIDSQGYIVDVYDDCIVLNGVDMINQKPLPIGTYKIDT